MRLENYGQLAPDASFAGTLQESSLQYGQRPSSNIDPALMRPGLQPMSGFFSLNSHLLTRPYYEIHNAGTNVTKLDFPTLSVTTSGFSYPWKTSGSTGRPHETSTAAIMDRQHRNVDFLYARLRDARSTIEKLGPADSIVGELCHADEELLANVSENPLNDVSRSAKLGNILSSSPHTITQQSMDLEQSQSYRLTSIPHSPIIRPSRAGSHPIQAHDPEGDSSNNTQGNLDSTKEIYSARKRKRQSTKDPTKFKHECNTCGERFTRSTTLREHSRTHTKERPFPCSSCSKKFARKKDKIRHENLHLGEKTFYCRLEWRDAEGGCGRCFTREDGLVAHLRTERGWKCLQDLMASTYCQTHIAILLRHENGFSCELTQRSCHGKFDDFSDLKDHLQDRANKDCATEWLTKIFLRPSRFNRFVRSFQDKDPHASSHFITKYLEYMDLWVVSELPGVNDHHLLTSVLSFNFTEIENLANRRSTTVQAKWSLRSASSGNRRDVYNIHLRSNICEWYWLRPVAVHVHFGFADARLFVGTRRHNLKGRLVWHPASPRETCPCSSCI